MALIVSHPTGSEFVRALLRALGRRDQLLIFWTAMAFPPSLARAPVLGEGLRRELGRRTFPEVEWAKVRVRPSRELLRIGLKRLGWQRLIAHETGWTSVDQVYRHLDRNVAAYIAKSSIADGASGVYAYEDGARDTFLAARARELRCIYDLPIAHWRTLRRLLREEAELNPAWASTMEGLSDSDAKLARKDEEISLAHDVVVASSFTRRSVEEHFGTDRPITVVPYGAPRPLVSRPKPRHPSEPLHLFYAGHLAQRKGVAYLIAALRRLAVPWHLTLAGPRPRGAPAELDALLADERCTWLGHVPHSTLLEEMAHAHVFVFPSIVEGFGMVISEAMASGLAVITTPNTAGPDIMTDGREGFIVPIRDPDAIAARLTQLYEDEAARQEMASAALACAARSGWEAYETRIADLAAAVAVA